MDLGEHWHYVETVARIRLQHNKTDRHISRYGPEIEVIGAAGELAARLYLGLSENLHTGFDNGVDLVWKGWTVDVKSSKLVPKLPYMSLQYPEYKKVKADIQFLIAVDIDNQVATPVGWATREMVLNSPINRQRYQPCHEISVRELINPWALYTLEEKANLGRTQKQSEYLMRHCSISSATNGTGNA